MIAFVHCINLLCALAQVGTTSGDVTFIDVSGLKPNTPYNFRVTASNVVGSGPPYAPEEAIIAGKMMSEFLSNFWGVSLINLTNKETFLFANTGLSSSSVHEDLTSVQ